MTHIGSASFAVFLSLAALTAFLFCLPYQYGWSWGVAIQLWALFGFYKLYGISALPVDGGEAAPSLAERLRQSLAGKPQRESEHVSGRLSRFDSMALMLAGSLMIVCVLSGAYSGAVTEGGVQRSLYTTLYLVAQIFCLGVIAFLAQLYAVRLRFVRLGVTGGGIAALAVMLYAVSRHGVALPDFSPEWWMGAARGTDIYLAADQGMTPFQLRLYAMGAVGALLPWLAMLPMTVSFLRVLMHPSRGKGAPLAALLLIAVLALYDLYALRSALHFAVILPAWVALTLAWARCGYGPLWSPLGKASRHDIHLARHSADFR